MNTKNATLIIMACITASLSADPRLHLKNKSDKPIEVGLTIGYKDFINLETVQPGWETKYDFPLEEKVQIQIFCSDCPQKSYAAQIPANKTIYIKWDGSVLQPQLGSLRGILGTTTAGYSLKNNVKQSDIKEIR
jgi:hypothetical protein